MTIIFGSKHPTSKRVSEELTKIYSTPKYAYTKKHTGRNTHEEALVKMHMQRWTREEACAK